MGDPKQALEARVLSALNEAGTIADSRAFATEQKSDLNHEDLVGILKSLTVAEMVTMDANEVKLMSLTDDGERYAKEGTPEAQVFKLVPDAGLLRADLPKFPAVKIGFGLCMKNKWLVTDKKNRHGHTGRGPNRRPPPHPAVGNEKWRDLDKARY
jgi:phenylalanyl-tRNA synthetase alpha chain